MNNIAQIPDIFKSLPVVSGRLIPPRSKSKLDCWQVEIICPFCGKKHLHGAGRDGELLGSRVAHCLIRPIPQPGEYFIVAGEK